MSTRKADSTTAPATAIKNNFGHYLDVSRRGPVEITKNGRTCAVLVAADEFSRLRQIEDRIWGNLVMNLHQTGDYLSAGESMRVLRGLMEGAAGITSDVGGRSKKVAIAKRRSTRPK